MTSRPPGFSTRAISRKTTALSGTRFSTQLLVTASTEADLHGQGLEAAFAELHVREAGLGGIRSGALQHGRRHVDPDDSARGAHGPRGQEGVEPASGAEVEDGLTRPGLEVGYGRPAPEAEVGSVGHRRLVFLLVADLQGDGLGPAAAAGDSRARRRTTPSRLGDLPVLLLHLLDQPLLGLRTLWHVLACPFLTPHPIPPHVGGGERCDWLSCPVRLPLREGEPRTLRPAPRLGRPPPIPQQQPPSAFVPQLVPPGSSSIR